MDIKYIRSSSINTYCDCEAKFFYEYVLKIPSKAGKKALLGTIVHHVLELLGRAKKVGHSLLQDKYIDPEYLLKACWARYTVEHKEFKYFPADYKFCKNSIEKVLNSNLNPLGLNVIETEKRFCHTLEQPEFKIDYYDLSTKKRVNGYFQLVGTMDLVTQEDPDTLHVIDYKTGKRTCWTTGKMKDYDYLLEKDLQLRMYDLATFLSYPNIKHRMMTIIYINDGGPFTISFDKFSRDETYRIIYNHLKDVQNNFVPSRIKEKRPLDKWKCDKVCHFGKTTTKHGIPLCDKLYSHIVSYGIDKTIIEVEKQRQKQQGENSNLTSNRRNAW